MITRAHAKEQARQLHQHFERESRPVWAAVQNRGEDDPDQYWIGRALSMEMYTESSQNLDGVGRSERYDKGDFKIEVEWFERDISGGDERRIFRSRTQADEEAGSTRRRVYTFNSSELREINVQMQLVLPVGGVPLNDVQPGRRSAPRAAAAAAAISWQGIRGLAKRVTQQRADPPDQLWEIPVSDERQVLDKCS